MERRHWYGGAVGVAGVILVVVQLFHGIQQLEGVEGTSRLALFAFATAPFVLAGVALTYVGYWLATRTEYEPDLPYVVAWGAGSAVVFASIAVLLSFGGVATEGAVLARARFVTVDQVTVGAVVGVLVGLYDARSRSRQRALQRERDRVEAFARKAADVNNYGRELNRSSSIREVSALCIQAAQAFLGVVEMAFVVTNEDESELIDETVADVPEATLVGFARDSLDQEPSTIVTHETLPGELAERADRAISVLITDRDGTAVVLLALVDETVSLEDEDSMLLEMLAAHAGTALEWIYDAADHPDEWPR